MMFGRVVFGPVVSIVGLSRPPVDAKLLLAFAIAEPMKTHVYGFGSFWSDFSVDDGIAWCCQLGVVVQVEHEILAL